MTRELLDNDFELMEHVGSRFDCADIAGREHRDDFEASVGSLEHVIRVLKGKRGLDLVHGLFGRRGSGIRCLFGIKRLRESAKREGLHCFCLHFVAW